MGQRGERGIWWEGARARSREAGSPACRDRFGSCSLPKPSFLLRAVAHHSYPFLDELKARFGGQRCPCGKVHRLAPFEVILGEGALESSARSLLERYGSGAS